MPHTVYGTIKCISDKLKIHEYDITNRVKFHWFCRRNLDLWRQYPKKSFFLLRLDIFLLNKM